MVSWVDGMRAFLFKEADFKDILGITGVLLIALFFWVGIAGANFGLLLVIIASGMKWRQSDFRQFLWQPVNGLFLIFILYVFGWEMAMLVSSSPAEAFSVSKEWLLLLVPWCGYWLYRFPHLIPLALLLSALGLFISTVTIATKDWDVFLSMWQGGHVFVARAWGLYLSIVSIGLIIFLPRFFSYTAHLRYKALTRSAYILGLLWLLQCLVAAQTRTAWVCFVIAVIVTLLVMIHNQYKKKGSNSRAFFVFILGGIGLLLATVSMNFDHISERFDRDRGNITKILSGDGDLTYTSATYRFLLAKYGYEIWLDAPVLGQGPIKSKYFIAQHSDENMHILGHLHSGYLELVVQLGLVGLFIFFAAVGLLFYEVWMSYLSGKISGDYMLWFFCVFLMIGLWSLFNFRMLNADWRFFTMLLFGIGQSLAMRRRLSIQSVEPGLSLENRE